MTFEEELIEYITHAISEPATASSAESYTIDMTREQYEEFLRVWNEMRTTDILLLPETLDE
jgi:hypothetical protein